MSDERELPERVFVHPGSVMDGVYDRRWTKGLEEYPHGGVPYLRADKPRFYVVLDRTGYLISEPLLTETGARAASHPERGETVHPVYIGPAIEPEEGP